MKILHFADIHCREKDFEEVKKCCQTIIDTAREERPDVIINAGDSFDSQNIKLDSDPARFIMDFHQQLMEIAPVAVVIGTPSHDGKAAKALSYLSGKYNLIVSERPETLYLTGADLYRKPPSQYKGHDAIISMIPTPTKQYFQGVGGIQSTDEQIGSAMSAIFAGFGAVSDQFDCPHILAGHFQVGGAFISESQQLVGRDIEVSRDQIALANADLVCLGHIHYAQKIGDNIFYSGSVYRKDFGEMERKGFYIHEIGGDSRFIETPTRRLVKIEADLTNPTPDLNIYDLDAFIYAHPRDTIKGAFVRCQFRLWQDEAAKLNKPEIEKTLLSLGAEAVEFRCSYVPRENVRSARILTLSSLREKIRERAELNKEEAPESVLLKADALESSTRDEVVGHVIAI